MRARLGAQRELPGRGSEKAKSDRHNEKNSVEVESDKQAVREDLREASD